MALSLGILSWPQAIHDVLIGIQMDAAAGAAIRANAFRAIEIPDPLFIEKILAAQGADRTDINHIAGKLIVARFAREDVNLGVMAAIDDLQLGRAADLARDPNSARAQDAAVGEERDLVADVWFIGRLVLVIDHSALCSPEFKAVILEQAFAGLV